MLLLVPLVLALQNPATATTTPTAPTATPPTTTDASVTIWQRAPGTALKPLRASAVTVPLGRLASTERRMKDVRGAELLVRGVRLQTLLAQAKHDATVDAVVLHFKNGTRIELPLADVARFDVFIALAVRLSDQGAWSSSFESVPLSAAHWQAGRALQFTGNRVLAGNPVPPRGAGTFNPWGMIDSLQDIEFINAAAWRNVFDVGTSAAAKKGLGVWENRCATCHGARGVGAGLGWDFVQPLSLAKWRTPESLFDHVRTKKLSDAEQGLLMPPQPDVTKDEIDVLHAWMSTLATTPLRDYAPPATQP